MSELGRPLPSLTDPVSAPFWSACREGRLELQRCSACRAIRWPPARRCPVCLSAGAALERLSGHGAIWSHARYERALHPAFATLVPYVVLAVALEEGPVMIAGLSGPEDGLEVGAAVFVVFTQVADAVTLPQFALCH